MGRYRIVDKIAEGGMGVVYRAQHTLLAERWAAIKFLRRSLSSEQEAVDRFFIEARAAASIGHAGIVEIFDFGYDEDNNVYLIMEYLEGETLKKRLRAQGILPTPEATALVRGVAGALEHAHAKNIIHRDLKPENIFLVKEPEFPGGLRPKVLDFGLAKLLEERGSGHTRTGIMLGTPTYMSPEQCAGSRTIDHRSDLYSLGCIFYELVCGRPPFVSDSVGGLIGAHMYAEVPSLHRWNETIHPVLEEVIITMLAKDPGNRFQSMGELRETLERAFPEELADEATERLVAGESSSGGVSLRDLWMSELASAGAARSNTDGLATQSLDIDILDIEDDDSGSYTDALRPREWLSELGPEPGARPPRSSSAPRRPAPSPGRASPMPPPRPPPAPRPREGARAVGPPVTIETRAVPPSPPMASNSPGARPREPEPAAKESPANGPLGSVQLSTLRGSAGEQASNRPAPAEAPMPSRHPEGPPRWSPAPALAGRRLSARSWSIGLGLMIVAAAVAALVLDAGSERSVSMSGEGRAADAGATRAVAV
ncbi:protein kinase domain-containing protein, partial [Haliangium sp.]|uniref:serine/threonine-protein kinase n=1 Tax=Haliangium sp. TaxID=2663208 RepID=UPI003D11597D